MYWQRDEEHLQVVNVACIEPLDIQSLLGAANVHLYTRMTTTTCSALNDAF